MSKHKNEIFDWIKALLIAFILAFVVRTYLFSPIVVDGSSMLPTLHDRDKMIVNKFTYRFNEPERFDIVVYHAIDQKRSEEHTSELQSRGHLVCRLLLEKKKTDIH